MKQTASYMLLSKLFLTHEGETFITPERVELLRSVVKTGSISGAAKAISKSYKWAWDSIEQMNALSTQLLVSKSSGGKGGGGAEVSPFALALIAYYDELEMMHQSKIERYQEHLNSGFKSGVFSRDIASTLHGVVHSVSYSDTTCDVQISYGITKLKAKCHKDLTLIPGGDVAFMVESNQIIIAKQAVEISAQNLLVGEISKISTEGKRVYLTLELESKEQLIVLITSDSLHDLKLSVGSHCFAYFKTYNITILGEKN